MRISDAACWCPEGGGASCNDAFVRCPFVFDDEQCTFGLAHDGACMTFVAAPPEDGYPAVRPRRYSIVGFS